MKISPLRLLLTALISTMLVVGGMAGPAGAGEPYKRWPPGWSTGSTHAGAYRYGSVKQVRYVKKWPKQYHYKAYKNHGPVHYKYKRRRHHDGDFVIGLGLGFLGAAILSAPYYRASGDWCHVHRYPVRGMTFHTDVRCFKHRSWNHPSILYVQ